MTNISLVFKRLAIALNMSSELTVEEKLKRLIKENQHSNLLERIISIRRNSDYEPDYNKPKKFIMPILYKDHPLSDFKPISFETPVSQERPVQFENFENWFNSIYEEHAKSTSIKALEIKQKEFDEMMEKRYENVNTFMNRMMAIH